MLFGTSNTLGSSTFLISLCKKFRSCWPRPKDSVCDDAGRVGQISMTIEKGVLWFHDLASRGTGQNRVALASSWLSAITTSGLVQGSKSICLVAFFKVASQSKVLQPMYTQVVFHMATMVES